MARGDDLDSTYQPYRGTVKREVTRRKVPESCATCAYSVKRVIEGWWWECITTDDGDRIPCARGKLPKPPKWCPGIYYNFAKRGGK